MLLLTGLPRRVEDYAGENGGTNYSAQYKNLAELVKKLDTEVLSKLDGSSLPSSSDNASSLETSEARRSDISAAVPIGGRSSPETHPAWNLPLVFSALGISNN
ncbi:probable proteasome inhibitor [Carya illinoinensis]|uniref:probable proteasome inhibitor n=1 Tax=Carya illinoinensis TaxID=32201 RepID=UPI001C72022B|nr:probable proteasome inhibitor [Carya illinoinensis]